MRFRHLAVEPSTCPKTEGPTPSISCGTGGSDKETSSLCTDMSSSKSSAIEPRVFYAPSSTSSSSSSTRSSALPLGDVQPPRWLRALDGPTPTWEVFRKQSEALQCSKDRGEGLMTFAFQEWDGTRRFLSAHPVVFWFYDSNHKRPEDRRTYEVITEGAVCKLYFDLEFEKEFNPGRDGVAMTNSFIKIVTFFMNEEFGVSCNRQSILDLDSTTESKFSRHLVFLPPKTYFRDNYNVGSFVKMVCDKVRLFMHSPSVLQDFCSKSGVLVEQVGGLFVTDKHGSQKLFCDEAVYTKNRHFRLFKSTKWRKNSPLLLSSENEYSPVSTVKKELPEQQLFLDSLITYVDSTCQNLTILEYGPKEPKVYVTKSHSDLPECPVISEEGMKSPLPVLDRFILRVVFPGTIRRSTYSSALNRITYEISGNRFCHNIGRPHKSNNVYYVVDIKNLVYYQKCHDSDCSGFQSIEEHLPPEIMFMLEHEGDAAFESVSALSDEELQEVWQAVSSAASIEVQNSELEESLSPMNFPEFGMTDSELLNYSNLVDETNM